MVCVVSPARLDAPRGLRGLAHAELRVFADQIFGVVGVASASARPSRRSRRRPSPAAAFAPLLAVRAAPPVSSSITCRPSKASRA